MDFVPIAGDTLLPDRRVNCRVRIEGSYRGEPFVYVDPPGVASQFVWLDGVFNRDPGNPMDPSTYWWSEGNYCCDCNRASFLPGGPELPCGETIRIDRIVPLDPRLPELNPDEYRE